MLSKTKQVLDFIHLFYEREGRGPTCREVGAYVGLSSTSSVNRHFKSLSELGLLVKNGVGYLPVKSTKEIPPSIIFELVDGNSVAPKKTYEDDSCWDVFAREGGVVEPQKTVVIPIGIRFEIPKGWEMQVRPRSGLSVLGFQVIMGTVDSGYSGEAGAITCNTSGMAQNYARGNKVAQICFRKADTIELVPGKVKGGARGSNGFGSSGK